jgi:hypothetical protein
LQHPAPHDAAVHSHLPAALHASPVSHFAQATPPMPHVLVLFIWQTPLESQHPPGHDAAVQTHLPCALHSWFAAHAAQTPPAAPQFLASGVATQLPFAQHPEQAPPPQLHEPLVHA